MEMQSEKYLIGFDFFFSALRNRAVFGLLQTFSPILHCACLLVQFSFQKSASPNKICTSQAYTCPPHPAQC